MSGTAVHPTAIVDPGAVLGKDVAIGPYAVIGPHVQLGAGTTVGSHAVVEGRTRIGERNRIFHHAVVGSIPQDLKYHGEASELVIGDGNTIREFTTLHVGTEGGGNLTSVGDENLFMNFSHVAHDCRVGSHVILANGATLAGHVVVEDFVIVGGLAGVHQFVRLGESAMLGGGAMVVQDVPPFTVVQGDRAGLVGVNVEGLRRRGFDAAAITAVRRAYREVFLGRGSPRAAVEAKREALATGPEVSRMLDFVLAAERGVCRLRSREG